MAEIANNSIDIQVVETGGENAQYFWHNTTDSGAGEGAGAHITEVPKADFVADPDNGGANTLIDSTYLKMRNGTETSAAFGKDGAIIGVAGGARTEIGSGSLSLVTNKGVNAFNVSNTAVTDTQSVSQRIDNAYGLGLNDAITETYDCLDDVGIGEPFYLSFEIGLDEFIAQPYTKGTADTSSESFNYMDGHNMKAGILQIEYTPPKTFTYTLTAKSSGTVKPVLNLMRVDYEMNTYVPKTEVAGQMIWKNPADVFVVEHYDHSYSTISSGNGMDWSETKTKAGYWPIGVVGFATNRAALVVDRCRIQDVMLGSCTIQMNARAVASASSSSADMYVLWIKAE